MLLALTGLKAWHPRGFPTQPVFHLTSPAPAARLLATENIMELEYKRDFDQTLKRFEAWWHNEIIDRPPVSMWVRPDKPVAAAGTPPPQKTYATLRDRWLDLEGALERFEHNVKQSFYFADTFPMFMPNVGPEVCATVFGTELEFGENTSWSKPVAASCRDILKIKPNLDNPYWNAIRKGTDLSLARGQGKWITALPDLHTNGDLPAALRDPQELCIDLVEDLEGVRLAVEHVTRSFALMYEDLWNRIERHGLPSTTWTPALHMGKSYVTSCDFICMISPEMFQKTILPSLAWEMQYLDRNIFHLDGPGALRHLDALLAQPRLNGVQWVCGAGQGPARKWIDVYKRIQAAGKSIQLMAENFDDAMAVAEHLKPQGVWFCIGGSYSETEGNDILRKITRWAEEKK